MVERIQAWIAENSAEDDVYLASGRFRAHIEIDLGDEYECGEELEDVALDEAIRWARERTPVVLVRLWDSDYFSAGETNPEPERFPALPLEALRVGPRRPKGLEGLDNTEDDPPVLWDLRLHAGEGADETAFRAAVERDPRALPVPPEAVDGRLVEGVRVLARASTQEQAWAIAEEISDNAWRAVGAPVLPRMPPQPIRARFTEAYPFAPDAGILFGGAAPRVMPSVVDPNAESTGA